MCGRGKLTATPAELRQLFGLNDVELEPHWNISPTQPVAIIRTPGELEHVRFGLIPSSSPAPKMKMVNVRAESLRNGAFRSLFQARRCLVVLDGFYEWKRNGAQKQPFLLHLRNNEPFALGAIWDRWTSHDGEIVDSCAVVTIPPVPPVSELHDRMPLVLDPAVYSKWLDPKTANPEKLLGAARRDTFISVAVSDVVNSPANDDPRCVEPVAIEAS